MHLHLTKFTEQHGKEVCTWNYQGEYSIYNYPDWTRVCSENWGISQEEKRRNEFYALVDDANCFCGYIRLVNKNDSVLIGVGLKPELCGQRLGDKLMDILKQQCNKLYPSIKIVLEVRSFNKRAIKCYEKAGFKAVSTCERTTPNGHGEFVVMEFLS